MHMFSNDYIVGLVDGEGSFTVYINDPSLGLKRTRRAKAEPKFYVKLAEKDKTILYDLKAFFQCGNVYFQKDTRKNHQNCYRYEVSGRSDIKKISIPFFRSNPLKFPSKIKDFSIFCDIFMRIVKGEHLTDSGLRKLLKIKQKMH